ncbi:MAG: RNA methyltransferase [Prevotellaceae bacterium]|nr:RNA methyltransferase [Prevotellaceae bacterium]
MISKRQLKTIKSLDSRKGRLQEGLFVAEGPKLVDELLSSFSLRYVAASEEWLQAAASRIPPQAICETVTKEELARISLLRHPQDVVALFEIPHWSVSLADVARRELTIALDDVQDPGNLGTIVRLADWFGICHVFCSHDTADIYNPKAVQATMGALARVRVHYTDLAADLGTFSGPVYGTFLHGENLYEARLSTTGVIVMGNEGNGISSQLSSLAISRLTIPPYPRGRSSVESLNVAVATAIVCAEFRRRS